MLTVEAIKRITFVFLLLILPLISQAYEKPEISVQLGHSGFVNSVAYSPDGRHAMSGCTDRTVKIWDVSTGRVVRTLRGHAGYIT